MGRRQHRARLTSTGAALLIVLSTLLAVGPTHSPPAAATTRTVALGAEVKPTGTQTWQQAVTSFESTTGRQLAFTRDYLLWDEPFPTSFEQWLGSRGTVPFISVNPKKTGSGYVTWSQVATAQPGSAVYAQMKAWADEIKAFGYPVYFTFDHEPEAADSKNYGTPADYIAAWRAFRQVFADEGVTNATWIWIMTAYSFRVSSSDHRYGWDWYPGDAYVDALGADAYNAYTCDNPGGVWHPLSWHLAGWMTFGAQHPTKPMWLTEWGGVEDPSQAGRKAQWISDAESLFQGSAYSQIKGIAYFNLSRPGTACDWRISTSTSAQTAYVNLAHDAFYSGTLGGPSGDTTDPTVSLTAPANGTTVSDTMAMAANASDDVGVASVTFDVDGNPVKTDTATPYTASVDTTGLSNGSHTLTAVATDTSGNRTTSAPVTVTVSNSTSGSSCPATGAGATELSGNLSLESGQTGWNGVYNASSTVARLQVGGGSYDGAWALQLAPKAGATGNAGVNNAKPYWVPGGTGTATVGGSTYRGAAEVRASVAGEKATLLVREVTSSGAGVASAKTTVSLGDTTWHPITTSYVAKNSGDALRYSLYGTFGASTQSMLADCLSLQSG